MSFDRETIEEISEKLLKFARFLYSSKDFPYKVEIFKVEPESDRLRRITSFYLNNFFLRVEEDFFRLFLEDEKLKERFKDVKTEDTAKEDERDKEVILVDYLFDIFYPYLNLPKKDTVSLMKILYSTFKEEKVPLSKVKELENKILRDREISYLLKDILPSLPNLNLAKVTLIKILEKIKVFLKEDTQTLEEKRTSKDNFIILAKFYFRNGKIEEHYIPYQDLLSF